MKVEAWLKKLKQSVAVFLVVVMTVLCVFVSPQSASAAQKADFVIQGYSLTAALKYSILNDVLAEEEDLNITDGNVEGASQFLFDEGKLYELQLYLDVDENTEDRMVRVFARLPEDADQDYELTGEEDIVFFFVNYEENEIDCSVAVPRVVNDEELTEVTVPIRVQDFESLFSEDSDVDWSIVATRSNAGPRVYSKDPEALEDTQKATRSNSGRRFFSASSIVGRSSRRATGSNATSANASASDWELATGSDAYYDDGTGYIFGVDGEGSARMLSVKLDELKALDDVRINGIPYTYSDEEVEVTVVVPEYSNLYLRTQDAKLYVTKVSEEDSVYDDLCRLARKALNGRTPLMSYYDIGFENEAGEHIDVTDEARVTFTFKKDQMKIFDGVTVLHFVEDEDAGEETEEESTTETADIRSRSIAETADVVTENTEEETNAEGENASELPDVDNCTGKVLDVLEIEVNDEDELLSVVFDTKGFCYYGLGRSSVPAGGMGTGLFTALGLLLIASAACFLGLKRRGGLLALVLCGSLALSGLTAGTAQAAQNASLTLTLAQTYEGQEATFSIYQVADLNKNLVGTFADYSDISLDCEDNGQWTDLARELTILVQENGIEATTTQGTENRTTVFSDIDAGWYLVIGDSSSSSVIPTPFVICVGDQQDMSAIVKGEVIPEETSPSETTEEPEETTTESEEDETTTAEETTSSGGSSHGGGGSSGGGSSSGGSTSGGPGTSGEGTSTEEDPGIAGWLPEIILSHLPQTGDLTNVILWTSLFAISGGGAILLVLTGRTRKHEDDSQNSKH